MSKVDELREAFLVEHGGIGRRRVQITIDLGAVIDATWNEAIEAAAVHVEQMFANTGADPWAANVRALKKGTKP